MRRFRQSRASPGPDGRVPKGSNCLAAAPLPTRWHCQVQTGRIEKGLGIFFGGFTSKGSVSFAAMPFRWPKSVWMMWTHSYIRIWRVWAPLKPARYQGLKSTGSQQADGKSWFEIRCFWSVCFICAALRCQVFSHYARLSPRARCQHQAVGVGGNDPPRRRQR
ncbi:hypothetical protein BKA80DRAFT_106583 [Phyllosticta citrichinensis]